MGICESKIPLYKEVALPSTSSDKKVQQRYSPMVSVEHKDNVNKKYDYLMDLNLKEYTGEGIFKTNKYVSLVDRGELYNQVNEFWGRQYEFLGLSGKGHCSELVCFC